MLMRTNNCKNYLLGLLIVGCTSISLAADTKAQQVIAQHLISIGTAEARAAVKSRTVKGSLHCKGLSGGLDHNWGMTSERTNADFAMRFASHRWDQFVIRGCGIADRPIAYPEFLGDKDFIIKEGLLGGELSPGWALEQIDRNRAKIEYLGQTKVDGQELLGVAYHGRSSDGVTVKLYFEPSTFHHVMSVHTATTTGVLERGNKYPQLDGLRYTIEERFSDFQTEGGISLPRRYDLKYTVEQPTYQEPRGGPIRTSEWDLRVDKVVDNPDLSAGDSAAK
jgi:hypothetical protein